jgi:predicted metal-dependent peptidase
MKPINLDDPDKKLSKAKVQLLLAFPFWGELVMRMVFHESETAGVGTTCVDHKGNMYYHPEWIRKMGSIAEVMFELAHEVMHLVQRCSQRFPQGGDHKVWNIAADIVVDTTLVDAGMTQSKVSEENVTTEIMDKHRGSCTEQVYYYLLKNPDEVENYGPCPHGQKGGGDGPQLQPGSQVGERGCTSGSQHGQKASSEEIEKWKQHIVAAAQNAQSRGNCPAFADEFLAQISTPSVTWKEILRRQATSMFRGRYTQQRQSRRSRAIGMRLPSRTRSPRGAVVMIDTSGSISDASLSQFVSECAGILRETGCQWLKIYFHDTNCYHIEEFNLSTIGKIKATRGGTSHIDVFKKVEENESKVGMIVAFTDLETSFPSETPGCPVIWAHPEGYENHKVPFGVKIPVRLTA